MAQRACPELALLPLPALGCDGSAGFSRAMTELFRHLLPCPPQLVTGEPRRGRVDVVKYRPSSRALAQRSRSQQLELPRALWLAGGAGRRPACLPVAVQRRSRGSAVQ